jgi:hypothetical protein
VSWQALGALASQTGPSAVLLLVVVAIINGRLIPRRVHLDRVGDLKAAIAALEDTVSELKQQQALLMGRDTRR